VLKAEFEYKRSYNKYELVIQSIAFTLCYVKRYPSLALENENSYFETYVFHFLIQFAVGTCNVRDSSLVYISGNMTNTLSLVRLCTLRNKSVTYDNGI